MSSLTKKLFFILAVSVAQLQGAIASKPFDEENSKRGTWTQFFVSNVVSAARVFIPEDDTPMSKKTEQFVQAAVPMVRDFFVSIVCPTPGANDPEAEQKWAQIRERGIPGYTWDFWSAGAQVTWQGLQQRGVKGCSWAVVNACKEHPLDAIAMGAVVLTGTSLGEYRLVPLAGATASGTKMGRALIQQAQSIDGTTLVGKGAKIVVIAAGVYMIANVPAAAALDASGLKTYGQLKDHYSGGPCSNYAISDKMSPIIRCLDQGRGMQECRALDTSTSQNDFRVFTVHPTSDASLNPVSTVKFGAQKEVCFLTALKPGEPVTETCFQDLANPANHTVKVVQDLTLADAHKGLEAGQSIQYFSMGNEQLSCASFLPAQAKYDLSGDTVCMLLKAPGAEGQQMCFNPTNPGELTLRPAPIDLAPMVKDNNAYALVVRNPTEVGLVIRPDDAQSIALAPDLDRIAKFMRLHKLREQLAELEQDLGLNTRALPAKRDCTIQEKEVVSFGSYKLVQTQEDPDCIAAMNQQEVKKDL